jgi:hypothetical protein
MREKPKHKALRPLLDEVREAYLSRFRVMHRSLAGKRVVTESTLRLPNGSYVTAEEGDLPQRLDIAILDRRWRARTLRVTSPPGVFTHDPFWARLPGGADISVMPFAWDHCRVVAQGVQPFRLNRVQQWFWRWFDPGDTRDPDMSGLHGIIHFMSVPEVDGTTASIDLDLGSAPVEALDDLLGCLLRAGAQQIQLSAGG